MAQALEDNSGGKSSLIPRPSWPSDTTILSANSTIPASFGDGRRTVIRPQLLERFWTNTASPLDFGKKPSLGTFDCAPNRMTLCSLLHASLPLTEPERALQATSTQRNLSPMVPLQRISRTQEYIYTASQPSARVCRLQAKQRNDVDSDKGSYTSSRKLKLSAAPIDFGEGTSPSASGNCRIASNCSDAVVRSRINRNARNTSRSRNVAADKLKKIVSPRNHYPSQAFLAPAEPAPLRLSLILPKSQQNQQASIRRCSLSERRNGKNELTNRLPSFVQYGQQGGAMAQPTAQAAHRKASRLGLGLKSSLVPQHKFQECLKTAECCLDHDNCKTKTHSSSNKPTPQMLEKSNLRCPQKGARTAMAQAYARTSGQITLTGASARLGAHRLKAKATALAMQSPVPASGSVETDFHSPLVAECGFRQRSFLHCAPRVPRLVEDIGTSSPSRKRQPTLECKPLPTPPVSIVQEKAEAGGHSERETATTAAATPPSNQDDDHTTVERVRKTGTHPGHRISVNSEKAEPNLVQSSQSCEQRPQTPGFVGETHLDHGKPASGNEDVEENVEGFSQLRHSEVSFVCVKALVSFLATCCTSSHFGNDERLQQANDLSTSPFHCSSKPQIGLEEYLMNRIFRHGKQTINEGVMAVALLSRFLCKQNTLLSAALRENAQQQQQQQQLDSCNKEAIVRGKDGRPGSLISRGPSATEDFAATAARIGYIEFNYLTAHRLLLTAAFLARKTHRDDHTSIRHWAQLGGVPVEDLVEAESAFVQVVEWRVQVTLDEFFGTALAISLGDQRLLGKQGELHPVRGNSATTAVYVREHALLMEQQAMGQEAKPTTPTTFRNVQTREQRQKTVREKMQLQRPEEAFTCCMCFSCCMLQPGQPKQRDIDLPFSVLAPPEGRAPLQDKNDKLKRSELIGSPPAAPKHFCETACQNPQAGSKINALDLPLLPSEDARAQNLSTTDTKQTPTMWRLNRSLNKHEYTAQSNICYSFTDDDSSQSPSVSIKPYGTSSSVLHEEMLQSKGEQCFKLKTHPFSIVKREDTRVPAAHADPPAAFSQTQ